MVQNALITGASSGIGRELAELHASRGHAVALVARAGGRLQEISQSLQTRFGVPVVVIPKDLSKKTAAAEIFDELQQRAFPVSILMNNAGAGTYGLFAEADLERELEMLQLNMLTLVQLTKQFLPVMLANRFGRILNVASVASFQPAPRMALYSASKAFVQSFSCALSLETKDTGVTVTSLCPGGTKTEFHKRSGMDRTAVFDSKLLAPMSAQSVARIGYDAMMQGKPVVVAGWKNKLMIFVSRRVSIMGAARVAEKLNRNR